MAHQCTICYSDFAFDTSVQDKSFLPVQSRVCSHVLCYACVVAIYQNAPPKSPVPLSSSYLIGSPTSVMYSTPSRNSGGANSNSSSEKQYQQQQDDEDNIPCPECRMPNAHNPFLPIVSRSLCELLMERHTMMQRLDSSESSSFDNDVKGNIIEETERIPRSPSLPNSNTSSSGVQERKLQDQQHQQSLSSTIAAEVTALAVETTDSITQWLHQYHHDLNVNPLIQQHWSQLKSTLKQHRHLGIHLYSTMYWTSHFLGGSPGLNTHHENNNANVSRRMMMSLMKTKDWGNDDGIASTTMVNWFDSNLRSGINAALGLVSDLSHKKNDIGIAAIADWLGSNLWSGMNASLALVSAFQR